MLHARIEFRVVIEFRKHGDGVLRIWIFRVSGIEFVEGHEIDFSRQSPLIDLFQEDGADFVRLDQMEEEARSGRDFYRGEKGPIHLEVFDQEAVVTLDHVLVPVLIAE